MTLAQWNAVVAAEGHIMIWSRGFSARFTASVVDPCHMERYKDIRITGGSIERNTEKMMESADISMTELIETGEAWIRIWLDARQDAGASAHIPAFYRDHIGPRKKS